MKQTMTIFRGLTFDIEVVEMHQTDSAGGIIFYLAMIHVKRRRDVGSRLVRRSRIPGAASEIARDILKRGIRALETFKQVA